MAVASVRCPHDCGACWLLRLPPQRAAQSAVLAKSFEGNSGRIRKVISSLRSLSGSATSSRSTSPGSGTPGLRRSTVGHSSMASVVSGSWAAAVAQRALSRSQSGTAATAPVASGPGSPVAFDGSSNASPTAMIGEQLGANADLAAAAASELDGGSPTERPHVLSILMAASSPARRRPLMSAVVSPPPNTPVSVASRATPRGSGAGTPAGAN